MTVEFGDVVETRYVTSEEQLKRSQFGFSPVSFSGNPIVYTPGDVVHLPYASGELSTIEAVGLAWGASASGIGPSAQVHEKAAANLMTTAGFHIENSSLSSGYRCFFQFGQSLAYLGHIPAI